MHCTLRKSDDDDPLREIEHVVKQCVSLQNSPDDQRVAIERYYTSDASFNHPLCSVGAAPGSREGLLRVYQWYRILSPNLSLQVHERSWVEHTDYEYDPPLSPTPKATIRRGTLFLEITQTFQLFFSPFSPRPARLIVKLSLVKESASSLWFIERQEDWYQPEDVLFLLVPPLATPVTWLKSVAGVASSVNARLFQVLGFWKTDADDDDIP